MARSHTFAPGEYYHLYSRGIEKRAIFIDKKDYERFIKILFYCNSKKHVVIRDLPIGLTFGSSLDRRGDPIAYIGAYCLMPNHFHLLVKEKEIGGISLFMQKLVTAYTMYFNEKYKRKGRLFESSYKSVHANNDEYLKYLYAYIHLNPIKLIDTHWRENGIKQDEITMKYLKEFSFSSFLDYTNEKSEKREEALLLNQSEFPQYFQTPDAFLQSLSDWISYPEVKPMGE